MIVLKVVLERASVFWCVDFQPEALVCILSAAQTSLSPLTLEHHPDRLTQPGSLSLNYSMNVLHLLGF